MSSPGREALDLSVLRRHTAGDDKLEAELLTLFEAQCLKLYPEIADAPDHASRGEAAHTLRGGAAAIGAGEVVRLAAAIEDAGGGAAPGPHIAVLVRELGEAIETTRSAIAATRTGA